MNRVKIIFLSLLLINLFVADIASGALTEEQKALNNPENFISVEFINAPLSEIIIMVAEYTGLSFVVSAKDEIKLSWAEQNIYKKDLLDRFKKVIAGAGLTINEVQGKRDLYIIQQVASAVSGIPETIGFYRFNNLDPSALEDTASILYRDSLAINILKDNKIVLFSGTPERVTAFFELMKKIDQPLDNDIAVIRLKNISVKAASRALAETKLIADNSFFADYWNRSLIVKGTLYQRNVALAIVSAIDVPQTGWIDQLEFVRTVDAEAVASVLTATCENVEVRKIASDRLLLSGDEKEVEKASSLLHRIDGTGLQVKVEAIIAYLTDREFNELGVKMSYQDSHNKHSINDNLVESLITRNTGLLLNYFNNLLGITVAAEKGMAHGEILSSPVLTVLNGQEARIHVGQNIPYLSEANYNKNDGQETGTSIQRKDVGITFTVKPSIEPDGEFVHLQVSQEVSNVTSDSELSQEAVDIIMDKKEIQSTVRLADGDTIFLGGLRSEEKGKARDHIPFLGELPFIGPLFSYDVTKNENRHLIVSLRVKVLGS